MRFAAFLPVVAEPFWPTIEQFDTRVRRPPDRTLAASGGGLPGGEPRPARMGRGDLWPLPAGVTALLSAVGSLAPSGPQVHGARHNGNEAEMYRPAHGRSIEGREPWTYR